MTSENSQEARGFCRSFFTWYNEKHHHEGIALFTPEAVYFDRVEEVLAVRQAALDAAYAAHPERFVRGPPRAQRPPAEVWINEPSEQQQPPVAGCIPVGSRS